MSNLDELTTAMAGPSSSISQEERLKYLESKILQYHLKFNSFLAQIEQPRLTDPFVQ